MHLNTLDSAQEITHSNGKYAETKQDIQTVLYSTQF